METRKGRLERDEALSHGGLRGVHTGNEGASNEGAAEEKTRRRG
jgi:hypothetical protein